MEDILWQDVEHAALQEGSQEYPALYRGGFSSSFRSCVCSGCGSYPQIWEGFTSKRCYYCVWEKELWKEQDPSKWPVLSHPDKTPPNLPHKATRRYKHDQRRCSKRDDDPDHPKIIYRDGSAAVNILNLATYMAIQVKLLVKGGMKEEEALQLFHHKSNRPVCFNSH